MKIKFNSDDILPLNKPLKFGLMTKTIRSVFTESGKFYPQLFLHDTLYELDAYFFFFYINFLVYIKMSQNTDLTYYQKSKNLILSKKRLL